MKHIMKNTRLADFINYRVVVELHDHRKFRGQLLAFDRHMNLVLADCEESRIVTKKGSEPQDIRRLLGLVMTRGETIISVVPEIPPSDANKKAVAGSSRPTVAPGKAAVVSLGAPGHQGPSYGPVQGLGANTTRQIPNSSNGNPIGGKHPRSSSSR